MTAAASAGLLPGFTAPRVALSGAVWDLSCAMGRLRELSAEAEALRAAWPLLAGVAVAGDRLALTFLSVEACVKMAVELPLAALLADSAPLAAGARVSVLLSRAGRPPLAPEVFAAALAEADTPYHRLHAVCRAVSRALRSLAAANDDTGALQGQLAARAARSVPCA